MISDICIIRGEESLNYPGKPLSIETRRKRLYHYTSFNSFVKIWLTKTLKFGDITDMNDIFESNFSSQCHSIKEMEYMNLYHEEKKHYKQISLTMDYDSFIQGCMSPMMWGQYADKGNGVCIEFDYNKLKQHIKPTMLHDAVNYVDPLPEPPNITQEVANDFDSFFKIKQKELFFTKHQSWSYENEYRIVSKGAEYLEINDAITAIYITKCKSTECECIEKLLEDNDDVYFRCVYPDSMLGVGTYYNICDVEHRKKSYSHKKIINYHSQ